MNKIASCLGKPVPGVPQVRAKKRRRAKKTVSNAK